MVIPAVQFDKDSSVVSSDAQVALKSSAAQFNQLPPGFKLVVEGYASAEGDATHNLTLAQNRADAVVAVLAANGVARPLLTPLAFGATGALNDASNRRVDTIVVRIVPVQ
jgi:outer membrane protein OmpA-like peptidoglycan-associated protein